MPRKTRLDAPGTLHHRYAGRLSKIQYKYEGSNNMF
jgi:hypothetical protein